MTTEDDDGAYERPEKADGEPVRAYGDWRKSVMDEYREALAELTPFQRKFVEAYLKSSTGAEAARVAGSQAKHLDQVAHNTKRDPNVQKAIALGMDCRIQAAALDDNEVIHNFREVFHKAMQEGRYSDANKANEALGKILGLFRDSTNVTDNKIADKARRFREEKAQERDREQDDAARSMLEILGGAKRREGTSADTRNIAEDD